MKRLVVAVLLCSVAVATVSVPAATASPLKQPEWGRCVEAASGRYADAGCTERVGKGSVGTFEWLRGGSIVKRGITGVAAGAVLETVGGRTIGCGTSGDGSGESPEVEMPLGVTPLPPTASPETKLTSSKANGTLGFNNCVESTYGSCGTITTEPLKAELGYIAGAGSVDPSVGLDMKAANGKRFAEVSCPGAAQPIVVEGSVISHIEPVDEMTTNFTETYTASEGVQSPTKLETGPTDVLAVSLAGRKGPFEQAGLKLTLANTSEEPIEIRAYCKGC